MPDPEVALAQPKFPNYCTSQPTSLVPGKAVCRVMHNAANGEARGDQAKTD